MTSFSSSTGRGTNEYGRRRERMVGMMAARRVVTRMRVTEDGGSSSSFSIALRAESCMRSAFSTIAIFRDSPEVRCDHAASRRT
jgi:hypothetical protein